MAGVLMLVIDKNETVKLINRKGLEILEFKEAEVKGKNWFDNFVPEKRSG